MLNKRVRVFSTLTTVNDAKLQTVVTGVVAEVTEAGCLYTADGVYLGRLADDNVEVLEPAVGDRVRVTHTITYPDGTEVSLVKTGVCNNRNLNGVWLSDYGVVLIDPDQEEEVEVIG